MPSYFLGFSIFNRDATGAPIPHTPFSTVQVYNVTLGASETALISNVNGHMSTQVSPVTVGTKLRFSVSPHSSVIERTTVAALADLEDIFERQVSLILTDAYTPVTEEPAFVEIYVVINDDFKNAIFIGNGRKGDVLKWHFESVVSKNLKFFRVPVSKRGGRGGFDLSTASYIEYDLDDHEAIIIDGTILARKFVTVSSLTAIEIYMPASPAENQIHHIKNVGAGVCTVRRSGTQQFFTTATVNNLTLYTGDAYWCRWTGTRWEVY